MVDLLVPKIKTLEWENELKCKINLIENLEILKYSFDIINDLISKKTQVPKNVKNDEISINYVMNKIIWNQNKFSIDKTFAYNIAMNVMSDNEDQWPMIIEDFRQRNDWPKWKDGKKHNYIFLLKERFLDL